jgi:hypothetical protein
LKEKRIACMLLLSILLSISTTAFSVSHAAGVTATHGANLSSSHAPRVPGRLLGASSSNVTMVQSTPHPRRPPINPVGPLSHWWLIDYWDTANQYGRFIAAANTITGLNAAVDDVLILPLNLAYGSSSNLEWFQFDIDFAGSSSARNCTFGLSRSSTW